MNWLRSGVAVTAFLLLLGAAPASAGTSSPSTARVAVVTVTAGKPSELAFKLSKTALITAGLVNFKVTNRGRLAHDFKLCTRAVSSSQPTANACVGKVTKRLKPGESQTLALTLAKGKFEYLCTVAGHAGAGMKGVLGIGVTVAPPFIGSTAGSTTTAPASTSATPLLTGDPAAGAGVFASAGCASCHTLRAAGATGTVGPNLDQAAPPASTVIQFVTNGGRGMPSFTAQLNAQQIANVAAYVNSVAGR